MAPKKRKSAGLPFRFARPTFSAQCGSDDEASTQYESTYGTRRQLDEAFDVEFVMRADSLTMFPDPDVAFRVDGAVADDASQQEAIVAEASPEPVGEVMCDEAPEDPFGEARCVAVLEPLFEAALDEVPQEPVSEAEESDVAEAAKSTASCGSGGAEVASLVPSVGRSAHDCWDAIESDVDADVENGVPRPDDDDKKQSVWKETLAPPITSTDAGWEACSSSDDDANVTVRTTVAPSAEAPKVKCEEPASSAVMTAGGLDIEPASSAVMTVGGWDL